MKTAKQITGTDYHLLIYKTLIFKIGDCVSNIESSALLWDVEYRKFSLTVQSTNANLFQSDAGYPTGHEAQSPD